MQRKSWFSNFYFYSILQRLGICLRWDIVLTTITINILGLALPIVILQLYDRIIPNKSIQTLGILILSLIAAIGLDTLLRSCRSLVMSRLGAQFEHKVTLKLLRTILHSDLSAFESKRNSDYLEKMKAIEGIRDIQFGQNILSLLDLPFVFLFLVMIWFFTGWLVLVPLGLFLIFTTVSVYISRELYKVLMERDNLFEHRHNFLLEVLQGIQTLKPLAMEEQMMRRYESLQSRSAKIIYRFAYVNNLIQASAATLSQFTIILFVAVGAISASSGNLSIGALAAGSMLAGRILQPASRALNFWMQWQTAKISEDKILSLLELPQEKVDEDSSKKSITGKVSIQNLTYTPEGKDKPLFKSLSVKIEKKEFVSIVGDNGSGKTTLTKILLGLTRPQSGTVLYDDIRLDDINQNNLRKQIGLVPQRGALFNGSILENLTSFRHGDFTNQALKYSQSLGLDDVIMRMRDGLATELDNTLIDNIPEGLRQRMVMVRAMVGDNKIILFDDANTGYDPKNSRKLVEFFESNKGEKTVIAITHEDQIIALSDRCFKLVDGKLVEMYSRIDHKTGEKKRVEKVENPGVIYGGRASG